MIANPAPADPAGNAPTGRPKVVDYALYAIAARCVFALLSALSLYASRGSLTRVIHNSHPEYDAAKLHTQVDAAQKSNLVAALGSIVVVLLVAKFIRDGRNWARWLFAVLSFIVTGDVLSVLNFVRGDSPAAYRVLSGLAGLSVIAAIFLLFLRAASPHFQPAGKVSASPLRMLFGAGRPAAAPPVVEPAPAKVNVTKRPSPPRRPDGSPRPAPSQGRPRAKSRKAGE